MTAWGFDIDETITSAPKQYAAIAKALRAQGDTIHVITGHGPAELRAEILQMLGFDYDTLAIVDPGEDGSGKAVYCAEHDISMMFDNNTDFGAAISAVCPVTFHYGGPTATDPAEPPAAVIHNGFRRIVELEDGPHVGTTLTVTGLTRIVTYANQDYRLEGDRARLLRTVEP